MNRYKHCIYGAVGLLVLLGSTSCGTDENGDPVLPDISDIPGELIKQCGLGCPGDKDADGVVIKGVLDGNVAISGVAKVDAFFGTVDDFRSTADNVSAGIEAQLALIKADFGIEAGTTLEAGLDAQFTANLEGELSIDYEPARCSVDASATLEAKAHCEVMAMPPKIEVDCKGSCEVEASATVECSAGATLECEFTGPTVDCQGTCEGSCEAQLEVAASCSGTCRGSCSGNCSAYTDSAATQCAGSCDGTCEGSCETKLAAAAECKGTCKGSCTVSGPDAKCEGAAHASCKAEGSASVKCEGKCEGDIQPGSASAECEASARAEAKLNVQCTPPRLAANYRLKAAVGAEVMVRARFEAALKSLLKVRLPALVAATARAKSIAGAGEDLRVAAGAAVDASVKLAQKGDLSVKASFGLACALKELPKVGDALEDSSERLTANLMASGDVSAAVGI